VATLFPDPTVCRPKAIPPGYSNLDKENQNLLVASANLLHANTSDDCSRRLDRALTKAVESCPDLARIVHAWPTLPEPIRRAVLALIAAGVGESG
jgi:hypothetical protein